MARTITKRQYLQLSGLLTLAERYNRELEDIKHAAMEITGDTDECGHTSDAVYGQRTIVELLKLLDITVETVGDWWEDYYSFMDKIITGETDSEAAIKCCCGEEMTTPVLRYCKKCGRFA